MLKTIVRSGDVLDLFSLVQPEWGVTEIARQLQIPKSKAHDLVSSLAEIDLLQRTEASRYRLGWRLFRMGTDVAQSSRIPEIAQPHLDALSAQLDETTHLAVWDGRRLVWAARTISRTGLDQSHAVPGTYLPAHCTASGKVLMAHTAWPEVLRRISANGIVGRTSRSIVDFEELRDTLRTVGQTGVGYNSEETDIGVCGLAVPVWDQDGQVRAALGVSTLLERFPKVRDQQIRIVKRTANRISQELRIVSQRHPH